MRHVNVYGLVNTESIREIYSCHESGVARFWFCSLAPRFSTFVWPRSCVTFLYLKDFNLNPHPRVGGLHFAIVILTNFTHRPPRTPPPSITSERHSVRAESAAINTNALCVIWDTPPSNSSNAPRSIKPMTVIQAQIQRWGFHFMLPGNISLRVFL